ncbi:MAG: Flp pilus assembly protein CpaB [Bdellovibrionales bacterium RBG_16_40_8]|nr:MAG: Flp pilus assembly protein CpaB [Bdellovibrionales bacterium RBG_16_40_8]
MNNNETRTLWISVGAALFAVFLLYSYTQERSAELTKKFGAKQRVVIATKDINEMETIEESKLSIEERPVDFVQPQALQDPERAVGMVALAPIRTGEQILENKIMEPGPVTGLSLQVAPGKRAVTLPIDEMRGVAKLIKPGDRIDLIASLDVGKGPAQHREIKTILQDVVILATGLKIVNELPRLFEKIGQEDYIKNIRSDTSFSTITIEASPQDSQNLIFILATSPGSLFITLRHPSDRVKNSLTPATVDTVLNRVDGSLLSETVRAPTAAPVYVPPQPVVQPKPVQKKKRGGFVDL